MALKPVQRRLVEELLNPAHRSIAAAAAAAGVPYRTAQNWLGSPFFRAALDAAEGDNLDSVARRTVSALTDVESLYTDMMADESKPDAIRLKAAQNLEGLALKLWEARHLLRRIENLERTTGVDNGDDWLTAESA